jgi:hypothetical protein
LTQLLWINFAAKLEAVGNEVPAALARALNEAGDKVADDVVEMIAERRRLTRSVEKLVADRRPQFAASQGDRAAKKELDRPSQQQFQAEQNARDLMIRVLEAHD